MLVGLAVLVPASLWDSTIYLQECPGQEFRGDSIAGVKVVKCTLVHFFCLSNSPLIRIMSRRGVHGLVRKNLHPQLLKKIERLKRVPGKE